jgi:hypothetical protein
MPLFEYLLTRLQSLIKHVQLGLTHGVAMPTLDPYARRVILSIIDGLEDVENTA